MTNQMTKHLKLVVCSGKGGVGKSMLTSSLALLFSKNRRVVAIDCDVDAPNLAVWLGEPEGWQKKIKISVSERPLIDNSKLSKKEAEECAKKCRFNALEIEKGKLKLNPFLCEGCGACEIFCPSGVIKMQKVKNGEIKIKKTKEGFPLISGQLYPGQTGSGKIVDKIKFQAEKIAEDFKWPKALNQSSEILHIIDSAPGTGCPVISALRDANFAILVTEPTLSGFSDLKKVLEVVVYFGVPWVVVINKWDINKNISKKIRRWSGKRFLGKISYDKEIFKTIANLTPIMKTNLKAKDEIKKIFNNLLKLW